MKTSIQNNSFLFFFFTSLAIFIYALTILFTGNQTPVNFEVFNNSFVVDRFQLTILFKVAYLLPALGYFLAGKLKLPLNNKLTSIHTYISVGTVLINALFYWIYQPMSHPQSYNSLDNLVSHWLITITLLAQPLFLYNIFQAIAKKNTINART